MQKIYSVFEAHSKPEYDVQGKLEPGECNMEDINGHPVLCASLDVAEACRDALAAKYMAQRVVRIKGGSKEAEAQAAALVANGMQGKEGGGGGE